MATRRPTTVPNLRTSTRANDSSIDDLRALIDFSSSVSDLLLGPTRLLDERRLKHLAILRPNSRGRAI